MIELTLYADLLNTIKSRIRQAQIKATFSVNSEMIFLPNFIANIRLLWKLGNGPLPN
ncbi:MAG: hypothetical protein ABII26_03565 [Pseudomonadota bacterium]